MIKYEFYIEPQSIHLQVTTKFSIIYIETFEKMQSFFDP